MKSQEFNDAVERALIHLYHGDQHPRKARYVVLEGEYPPDLGGHTFTTVFPFAEKNHPDATALSHHILSGHGRILTMELDPTRDRDGVLSVRLSTRAVENETEKLRRLAPEAFLQGDFLEMSWFGASNLSNVSPLPAFSAGPEGRGGARLFASFDAGRPAEISPQTLEFMSPWAGRASTDDRSTGLSHP